MKKLFGTDGIRGEANVFPMTPEIALQVGRAIGYLFRSNSHHVNKIIIGKDTRLSGYLFEMALTAGLCSMGSSVYLIGPLPTPGIAFLTKDMRADAGVVISASHNPFFDNGIKIFDSRGFKLSDDLEERIESLIFEDSFKDIRVFKKDIGRTYRIKDALGRYAVHLKSVVPPHINFEGLKVGIDCANGACYQIGPMIFEELGAKVSSYGCHPDGTNINDCCGALYPDKIREILLTQGLDIAIALDGDGDRIVVIDDKGVIWDGDDLLALFSLYLKKRGLLKSSIVVGTVMTNSGLEFFLNSLGLKLQRTPVGDRYVVQRMLEEDSSLGGETSGHIIFLDKSTTGDGLLCAVRLLSIITEEERKLSDFYPLFEKLPQVLINIKVKEKAPIQAIPGLQDRIKQIEEKLGSRGRVLIRPSGTEPKYRVMVEAEDQSLAQSLAEDLADLIRKALT
ncbi:MAG: phosphoglucosamine mutase [Caldimicrobium sp.]|nr:phosphoglucosamine mutase [Caldimicrobium sp.]MCX7613319.1 phosphoglucosamine mutase [Caldimicrobium sp.]MDW8183400.1 phosphoglucosamine mutase [Caldimicrobium sp.]